MGLATIVSFAGSEILVRLTVGAPLAQRLPILEIRAHPSRGWEMVPGQTHYTYDHPVEINSLGLRGREPAFKAPGEIRVLALGDTALYGVGVADDETIPFYLEATLNERDRRGRTWTVVNGGQRAYNTRQEVALLEELQPRLDPDLVVLFWYWNDLEETDLHRTYERIRASGPVAFDTKTRVEGWARWKWRAAQLPRRSALLMYLHDLARSARADSAEGATDVAEGLERFADHLDRLQELARSGGFELVVALIPDPNALGSHHASQALAASVVGLAVGRGIPHVGLDDALRRLCEREARPPVLPFDGHYRPNANRAMAESVAELVLGRTD